MKEKQEGFFSDKELSEKEKEEKAKERKQARTKVDHVERAGTLLTELAKKSPKELAELFEGEVGKHLEAVERVRKAATEAAKKLRKAKAMSEAKQLEVRPELEVALSGPEAGEDEPAEVEALEETVGGDADQEPTEAELAAAEAELAKLPAADEQEQEASAAA
ncbi:hypothetical protein [Streptomyces monashensis]|uniref:Uncharacterized protein n=1 Tax=Streptomyces monashensis TaxID=1678012 RepID=A0A1S2QNK9_9ACTN|nr:hypothetical protein [Streptomyces monashensis]OIK07729.1 hypothetical protein BIV23_01735 [Streptomyces monashensis]